MKPVSDTNPFQRNCRSEVVIGAIQRLTLEFESSAQIISFGSQQLFSAVICFSTVLVIPPAYVELNRLREAL